MGISVEVLTEIFIGKSGPCRQQRPERAGVPCAATTPRRAAAGKRPRYNPARYRTAGGDGAGSGEKRRRDAPTDTGSAGPAGRERGGDRSGGPGRGDGRGGGDGRGRAEPPR